MDYSLLCYIATAVGVSGQFADGFTTYQGVKKFGLGIEGDKSAFAQWLIRAPWRLFVVKPAIFAAAGIFLTLMGPATDGGGFFCAAIAGVAAAILGWHDAIANARINAK
jgi:hypothetical protein